MTTDKLTTIWGGVSAIGVAVMTYLNAGIDLKNPGWWAGMVTAVALAVKGFYTNKA